MITSNRFVACGSVLTVASAEFALLLGCVAVFSPNSSTDPDPVVPRTIRKDFFPFQDTTCKWWYSDSTRSHHVFISVINAIDDNGVTYYKAAYQEDTNRIDDWFRRMPSGIQYSTSLTGTYTTFLPDTFADTTGSFVSDSSQVMYHYYPSQTLSGKQFSRVMVLRYTQPLLHGFGRVVVADSVGIVGLIDTTGRFPLTYSLDSAHVHGAMRRY